MDKLTQLLTEAKPYYFKRKRNRRITAAACAIVPCIAAFVLTFSNPKQLEGPIYDVWTEEIYQAEFGSVIEDLGFPVDEYGLLQVG